MRNQYGEGSGFLQSRPNPRPVKQRDADDDDEPTYVDEESNEVLSKEQYLALVNGESLESEDVEKGNTEGDKTADGSGKKPQTSKASQGVEIGGVKKRKQAKVVGQEEKPEESKQPNTTAGEPRKKKAKKKIKLSFDEE